MGKIEKRYMPSLRLCCSPGEQGPEQLQLNHICGNPGMSQSMSCCQEEATNGASLSQYQAALAMSKNWWHAGSCQESNHWCPWDVRCAWPTNRVICAGSGHGSYYQANSRPLTTVFFSLSCAFTLGTHCQHLSWGALEQCHSCSYPLKDFRKRTVRGIGQFTSSQGLPKTAIESGYVGYLNCRIRNFWTIPPNLQEQEVLNMWPGGLWFVQRNMLVQG